METIGGSMHLYNQNNVLIVDDMPENLELLSRFLVNNGFKVRVAIDGTSALRAVQTKIPDLILLDIKMPDISGYDVCRKLKESRHTADIPIIFISGLEDSTDKLEAFEAGGVDYILKPFQAEEVIARVKTHLALRRLKKNLEKIVDERTAELNRLAFAFEQIAEGVIITEPGGIIEYTNPAFEKITGYSRSEVIGKTSAILKSRKHSESLHQNLWQTILDGKTWEGRIKEKKKDGSFISLDISIAPIYNDNGDHLGFVTVARDVTEHIKIERMLQQAQKMEAIGTLAGGIAHDFNNILSVILGYAELAVDKNETELSSIKDYLKQIYDSAYRARDLVAQILAFSRQKEQEKRNIKVAPLAKEVVKFLTASLPSNIDIVLSIQAEHDYILADPTQIHQVFMNLCTNAWHAMKEKGGKLQITINNKLPDATALAIYPELTAKEYLWIEICDTGYGIKKEDLDSIFIPYFTTKPTGEGTGLGLAVVHGIVKGASGFIYVKSEVNNGTVFDLFFPVCEEGKRVLKRKSSEIAGTGNETILFVDDEPALNRLGKVTLTPLGYTVINETDPHKALSVFKERKKEIDLVITDKTMPGMSGFDLAAKIRAVKNVPVLLCTGYCDHDDFEMCRKAGIAELIKKPFVRSGIAASVRKALDDPS